MSRPGVATSGSRAARRPRATRAQPANRHRPHLAIAAAGGMLDRSAA
jgi:hypothetical protein